MGGADQSERSFKYIRKVLQWFWERIFSILILLYVVEDFTLWKFDIFPINTPEGASGITLFSDCKVFWSHDFFFPAAILYFWYDSWFEYPIYQMASQRK
jgi:hypothetical protein